PVFFPGAGGQGAPRVGFTRGSCLYVPCRHGTGSIGTGGPTLAHEDVFMVPCPRFLGARFSRSSPPRAPATTHLVRNHLPKSTPTVTIDGHVIISDVQN